VLDSNPFCEPLAVAIAKVIVPLVVTGVEPIVTPLVADDKPTEVTVPPLEGDVFVIVKFGYVPDVLMPVPAVNTTVWSGAVFVIVSVPLVVIGEPLTEIPVPADAATEVTVPVFDVLLLNVVQSAELKAPLLLPDAVGTFKVITGVVVPLATVLFKSVPVVPKVKAATLVTLPVP
jgi:hypothetical protein